MLLIVNKRNPENAISETEWLRAWLILYLSCSIEYGNEIIHQQQLDLEEDGPAIELHFDDTGSTCPMLVYATGFGNIIGWDLRQPLPKKRGNEYNGTSPAFKLENDLRDGVMTSMATNHDKV